MLEIEHENNFVQPHPGVSLASSKYEIPLYAI